MNTDVQAICQHYLEEWRKELASYKQMIEKCCGEKLILCNELRAASIKVLNHSTRKEEETEWEPYSGKFWDEESDEFYEIYQDYIISEHGAEMLRDYTDELVMYNAGLDIYLLCVTHYGTSWDYVPSNWKEFYKDFNPDVNDVDDDEKEVF